MGESLLGGLSFVGCVRMKMFSFEPMQFPSIGLAAALAAALAPGLLVAPVQAQAQMTLDQACAKFGGKLNEAVASGDTNKARQVYTEGSKRVASHFNGATCPNVKAP